MKKIILALFSLTLAMAAGVVNSAPVNLTLVADNQRSGSGTLGNLIWKTCDPPPVTVPPTNYAAPCVDPTNPWVLANNVTGSTATWTWDAATGLLASTGLYWSTSYISSNPGGSTVISDKTMDLAINTRLRETTATSYVCIEGNFLAGVGANGCGNYDLGTDFATNSSVAYNVVVGAGPDALCVVRTLNPDDVSTGNPRGVATTDGSTAGCDPTDGAYVQYNIVFDSTATGGQLRLANEPWPTECYDPLQRLPDCAGATFLTFNVSTVPIPPTVWLLGTGLAGLGGRRWLKRKIGS